MNRRGYGRYTRNLLTALARREDGDRHVIFVDPETGADSSLPMSFRKVVVGTRAAPARAASASGHRSLRDLWRMSRAVAAEPLDAFFFPSVYTFFPLTSAVPTVTVFHDTIAERLPALVFARRRFRTFWRLKARLALRQSRMVLTVSDHARARVVDYFRLPPERVRVVLEAPDPIFGRLREPADPADLLPGCALPRGARYLLYVGGLSPHKNLPALIDAYRTLRREPDLAAVRLLLVGDHSGDAFHSEFAELRRLVHAYGLERWVSFTGFLPDEVLAHLYNVAEIVVLPSFEEGFGLPAFEAAACGTPVVVSDVGPAGALLDGGAVTFPPRDVATLTRTLRELLRAPERRAAMGAAGCRRAAALSWDRAAAEVRHLLHEVAQR